MNKMNKTTFKKILTLFIAIVAISIPLFVYAWGHTGSGGGGSSVALQNPLNNINSFSQFISSILQHWQLSIQDFYL